MFVHFSEEFFTFFVVNLNVIRLNTEFFLINLSNEGYVSPKLVESLLDWCFIKVS